VKKSGFLLVGFAGFIGIGIILSFYGSYVIFEDLNQGDGDVGSEQGLIVEVELDPTEIQTGIYAVQIIDFEIGTVTVNILDPFNTIIESQSINEEAYEGLFDITTSGTYKLSIENSGKQVKIFGVIGPEPDAGKRSLPFISLSILVIGLMGMLGLAVFMAINRKKSIS
jgi:hypothetical protein